MSPKPLEYEYSKIGPTWDHHAVLPVILEHLKALPLEGSVLDIGCGNGSMLTEIRRTWPWRLYGTDSSESGVAIARSQGLDVRLADSTTELLDCFGRESFDLILGVEVIEHVYDPRGLLHQAHAVLRPKGRLVLTTPYHGYLKNLAIAVLGKCDSHYNPLWDCGHIKFWSHRTLSTAVSEAGFSNITFSGTGRIPFLWKSMVLTATRADLQRKIP